MALSRCRTLEGLVLATPLQARAIISDDRVENYIAQQEGEAQRSIAQLPTLKEEYFRHLLLELFDFRTILTQEEHMVRLFAEYFYNSHSSLMQLHNQTFVDLRQQIDDVAGKWAMKIRQMSIDELHTEAFLQRVQRSADYFAETLKNLLEKPLRLTAELKPTNKQAAQRLSNILSELRQTWLARRYLLMKIGQQGFSVTAYLKEKQMSMLDALDESDLKPKREKKQKRDTTPKAVKEPKEKTWDASFRLFQQGLSPEQIAHERGLTVGTVFGHLARFISSGQVSLDSLVSSEHQQAIRKIVNMTGPSESITAIKNLCPPDVTFEEIRLVVSLYK